MALPRYAQIKTNLRERIERGALQPGDRVPSENQLAEQFGVSRMTARRALLELTESGLLMRSQGLGSFVADTRPLSSITQVRNIADEIAQRGHSHSARVLQLKPRKAGRDVAQPLGLEPGAEVYHAVVVHRENDVPIQHESRWVAPEMAPAFLQQDFSAITPSAYLSALAPLTEAEQSVEAVLPEATTARALGIARSAACLRITRRTFANGGGRAMSLAVLIHPGDRYRLGSHINV